MSGRTGAPTGPELTKLLLQAVELGVLPRNLEGHEVVFTGTLGMKREDLKRLVQAAGGRTPTTLGYGSRSVLVCGDTGRHGETSKMRTARERRCSVWTESELVEKIMPTS